MISVPSVVIKCYDLNRGHTRAARAYPHRFHSREHRRGLSRRVSKPAGEPDRPQRSPHRQSEVRYFRRRQGSRATGDGSRVPQRRLAVRLLPRSNIHARCRNGNARRIFCAALRRSRCDARSVVGRAVDERALRVTLVESRRLLEGSDGFLQHFRRRFADRLADAEARRACVGVKAISRNERGQPILESRRRNRVGHDRQRELRRRIVLGIDQCRRRASGADARLDLGRRLRHLRVERVSDHERESVRAAEGISARSEAEAGFRHLHRQRLGLPVALRNLSARRGNRAHGARAGNRARCRDDAAAGAFDLRKSGAIQIERAAAVGS